jgi:hypothetical protein
MGRRRAQLFGKASQGQQGTTKLYPLFSTFPWHLVSSKDPKCTSSFLSLHFLTVALIGLLLFMYSLLSAWPLYSTATANGYQDTFKVDGMPSACPKQVSCSGSLKCSYWMPQNISQGCEYNKMKIG